MDYNQYKAKLHKIKFSHNQIKFNTVTALNGDKIKVYDMHCDLERHLALENEIKREYYKQSDSEDSYASANKGLKTNPQHNSFFRAVDELLPQYNEYLSNTGSNKYGEIIYNKEGFEDFLKLQGGLKRKKTKAEAVLFVKTNLSILKKYMPDGTPEEFIERDCATIVPDTIKGQSQEKMREVLNKISLWAMDKGFTLSISRELMDLVK